MYNNHIFFAFLFQLFKLYNSFTICRVGDICKNGITRPCSVGHYCPPINGYELPCPKTTYSSVEGLYNIEQCKPCDTGHYCNSVGLVEPILCTEGKMMQYPRAIRCNLCTPGFYCDSQGLPSPVGPCHAGYYCAAGSKSPTNQECIPGSYCPIASSQPIPCRPGTYTGKRKTIKCNTCDYGYFCPEGSIQPLPCPSGTFGDYNSLSRKEQCTNCSKGFFCMTNGLSEPTSICPKGHYCPSGTINPTPCPLGTHSNKTGNFKIEECETCPPGYFCSSEGLSEPTNVCHKGYYCLSGSVQSKSTLCPLASYCPAGSSIPIQCPSGTFSNRTGLINASSCNLCPAGHYCLLPGATQITSICPNGSYCPEGSSQPINCSLGRYSVNQGMKEEEDCQQCPHGHYCPTQHQLPYKCPPGTYADKKGFIDITECIICKTGSYCLEASSTSTPCPKGTYSNITGNMNISNCNQCIQGHYCSSTGLTEPNGLCTPGYYCINGSKSSVENICHEGSYCPMGSSYPIKCPKGTFRPNKGATSRNECLSCNPGKFCAATGLIKPTGTCVEGHYCPLGTVTPIPCRNRTYSNVTGISRPSDCIICPAGNYCPKGSTVPTSCRRGTYSDGTGAATCIPCAAGWYCLTDGLSRPTERCDLGQYCPTGSTKPIRCPSGTYADEMGLAECKKCAKEMYCPEGHKNGYTMV